MRVDSHLLSEILQFYTKSLLLALPFVKGNRMFLLLLHSYLLLQKHNMDLYFSESTFAPVVRYVQARTFRVLCITHFLIVARQVLIHLGNFGYKGS